MPASKLPRRQSRLAPFVGMALRQSLVHAFNLGLYVFMALLVLLAGLLLLILSREDIPLPDFLLRRIEARLTQAGIEASFSRARLDLHGGVVIQNLRLEPARFGEPVVEARLLFLNFDELFLAAGMIELSEARAEDVRIFCPSALSPSGSPFPLLRIASVAVERVGRAWKVHGMLAESGTLHISAQGAITPSPSRSPRAPLVPGDLLDQFAAYAPKVARALGALEALDEPRLDLTFEVNREGHVHLDATASAASWSQTGLGEAREVRVSSRIEIAAGRVSPFDVTVLAAGLATADGIEVEQLAAAAHWEAGEISARPAFPVRVTASVARVIHPQAQVSALSAWVDTHAYPNISGELVVRVTQEDLEVAFSGDASTRAGVVEARTRGARDWLQEASRVLGRDVTYYATITEPPDLWGRARIGPGGKWTSAEFRALSGPLVARGVALDRARVHGVIVPERVDIDHLEIALGDQHAIGTYFDQFQTRDHRLVMHGSMRPVNISGWFGPWWPRFWEDFTFQGPPPVFDIDVAGNWKIKGSDVVLGRGTATAGTARGIPYDSIDLRFDIRSNYYDLFEATLVRPEGTVTGEVQLQFREGQRDAIRTRFDFESTADLVELARIFGKGGEALLEPYRYNVPPWARVSGEVLNNAGAFDTTLAIQIESPVEFRYHDFPVSSISTEVKVHNDRVEIPRLVAAYGGGVIRASATADAGILDVKAAIEDASYDDATRIFNDFLDRRSPPPPEERDPAGLAATPPGGRLNLGVEARGPITTFDAYEGTGSLRISEANLGRVRIFGLLSNLLGTINPRLGSLSFSEANTSFAIRRDRVAFPDLRVSGRTAALETEGTYYINSKNLDFRARLYPLGEAGGTISQLFELVLDPFSFLLEMRLTGTLRKPSWSLSRMPFATKPVVDEGVSAPVIVPGGPESAPAPSTGTPPDPTLPEVPSGAKREGDFETPVLPAPESDPPAGTIEPRTS